MLEKIISGGQTGVDRAALDVALEFGIACGGSCPAGRTADDGPIPEKYPLTETSDYDHLVRTGNNVKDSDGSMLLYRDKLHGGTAYAMQMAKHMSREVMAIDLQKSPDPQVVVDWINRHSIHTLHIGGQREKTSPGIYQQAHTYIQKVVVLLQRGE